MFWFYQKSVRTHAINRVKIVKRDLQIVSMNYYIYVYYMILDYWWISINNIDLNRDGLKMTQVVALFRARACIWAPCLHAWGVSFHALNYAWESPLFLRTDFFPRRVWLGASKALPADKSTQYEGVRAYGLSRAVGGRKRWWSSQQDYSLVGIDKKYMHF